MTQKLAFLGQSASGKSYAAMKLAELLAAVDARVEAVERCANAAPHAAREGGSQ